LHRSSHGFAAALRFAFSRSFGSLLLASRSSSAAIYRHLIDLSNGVGYVSGRSRVRLIGLSKLDGIVDHDAGLGGLHLSSSLVFLLLEDFSDGDPSSLAGPSAVQEFFEAPAAAIEASVSDASERAEEFGLEALFIGKDVPALALFEVGVFLEVEDGSDHDDLVKADGFDGFVGGLVLVERPHHDNIVEGDRFIFGFLVLDRLDWFCWFCICICLLVACFDVLGWLGWLGWR